MKWLLALVCLALLPPGSSKSAKRQLPDAWQYRYEHLETTGLTSQLIVNGKKVMVEFDSNSVQSELDSLLSAGVDVSNDRLIPTDIVVVGRLDPEVKMTPRCGGCALYPEPYQEFRLDYWYEVGKAP